MRVTCNLLLLGVVLLAAQFASAAQSVKVGAYHFPPYISKPESAASGLLPELLDALNASQNAFHFELVPTSVTRRYRDLEHGRFDAILFESLNWGWQNTAADRLDLQVTDAEVYVAHTEPGRGQEYFDSLKGKRMALYSGYHYGFAGFNADQEYLSNTYNAVLTYSHDSNLLMLLHRRADLSVLPRSYLRIYLQSHPQEQASLLVSTRIDQVYHHHALLRRGGPISAAQLDGLLAALERGGQLGELLRRYQLQRSSGKISETANPMR